MTPTLHEALRDLPEGHDVWRIGDYYIAAKTQRQAELHYVAELLKPEKILRKDYAGILLGEINEGKETDGEEHQAG